MGPTIIALSLLPVIIYILIIYITVPHKKINLGLAFLYLTAGFTSVAVLKWIWALIPASTTLAESIVDPSTNPFSFFHYFYFTQVAFLEEISKLSIFLMMEYYRRRTFNVKDHPIATMAYMGMVGLGFAVMENLQYAQVYGADVLYWRAITAVVGHMVFGLFMGYWIAVGRMGARHDDTSLFDNMVNKRKGFRNALYVIIGLFAATTLHGIYNLQFQFNGQNGITVIYMLLIGSIIGAYWCFKNLLILYREKQEYLKK